MFEVVRLGGARRARSYRGAKRAEAASSKEALMRKTTRLVGMVAAAALALSACSGGAGGGGSSDGGPVTLSLVWWGNDERAAMYKKAVTVFEKKNPGIKVNANFGDYKSYWKSRSTEAAARALPDVMQFDQTNLVEYAQNGQLLDLKPFVDKSIKLSGIDPLKVEAGAAEGQQVGIPVGTSTRPCSSTSPSRPRPASSRWRRATPGRTSLRGSRR
jgi:multiple sugar transport system substrate-binding protein